MLRLLYILSVLLVFKFNLFNYRMMSFDLPENASIFEQRYKELLRSVPADHPFNVSYLYLSCPSLLVTIPLFRFEESQTVVQRVHLTRDFHTKFLEDTIKHGGEGVILQKCGSLYAPGRSSALFKLKVFSRIFLCASG